MDLQEKLERARKNLNNTISDAEDIVVEELEDNVKYPELIDQVKPTKIEGTLVDSIDTQQDVIQLYQLTQDFQYIRETLRENQQNGRRVLRSVQNDILDSDESKKASLIMSFQELNKAIQDNIKLYISTYKTISDTLKNIQQIQEKAGVDSKAKEVQGQVITTSTQDIIARIKNQNNEDN